MKRLAVTKRRLLIVLFILVGFSILYLLLLIHPDFLFAYEHRQGRIVIRSDEAIPAGAESVLSIALNRLAKSPLDQPAHRHLIYVCNHPWRFLLFANFRWRVGGLTFPPLSNNIFLRAADFDENRLISPSGIKVPGARTLSYFIAHEITHTLIAERMSSIGYFRLADWKNEGYCDYVAKGRDFSYDHELQRLRKGHPDLDPGRSGLYTRYHLLVAHLLDKKGIGVDELLERDFDSLAIERELLATPTVPAESPR